MRRQDHWLLAHEREDEYNVAMHSLTVACGVLWDARVPTQKQYDEHDYVDGMFIPGAEIGCPDCRATALYKETIVTIEIGFDGNEDAWWTDRKSKLPFIWQRKDD